MTTVLELRNRIDELSRLELWLRDFAGRHGIAGDDLLSVNLVLEELFANVIDHGHEDGAEHEIVIRLSVVERDLHIEFEDDGRAFDPADAPAPDLDSPLAERRVGGLGLHLVKSFVDHLHHRRADGKNKLHLVKKAVVGVES